MIISVLNNGGSNDPEWLLSQYIFLLGVPWPLLYWWQFDLCWFSEEQYTSKVWDYFCCFQSATFSVWGWIISLQISSLNFFYFQTKFSCSGWWSTIMFIAFWDFFIVGQVFLLAQVNQRMIISNKLVYRNCQTSCRTT